MTSLAALADRVVDAGTAAGLAAIGITTAAPFPDTRAALHDRRSRGQHAGMSFTFRRPERSTDPRTVLPSAQSIIAAAWRYPIDEPTRPFGATGRVARYAWRDHYADLRGALDTCASELRADGHRAVIVADQNAQVDRAVANRAGIGWWGKNTNLVIDGIGSWFVLGAVVTDAALPERIASAPGDGCRSCTRCITSCPTDAIIEPGRLDARRCLAWIVQQTGSFPRAHRIALGDRLYGCDSCIDVCPPGRPATDADLQSRPVPVRLTRRRADQAAPDDTQAFVDIVALLGMDDDDLLARFGRWYIPDRDPVYLRRNALVVLGNVGDPLDDAQIGALCTALEHEAPIVRAHAVWAAARLGRHDLLEPLAGDDAAEVRAELALASAVPLSNGAAP